MGTIDLQYVDLRSICPQNAAEIPVAELKNHDGSTFHKKGETNYGILLNFSNGLKNIEPKSNKRGAMAQGFLNTLLPAPIGRLIYDPLGVWHNYSTLNETQW